MRVCTFVCTYREGAKENNETIKMCWANTCGAKGVDTIYNTILMQTV